MRRKIIQGKDGWYTVVPKRRPRSLQHTAVKSSSKRPFFKRRRHQVLSGASTYPLHLQLQSKVTKGVPKLFPIPQLAAAAPLRRSTGLNPYNLYKPFPPSTIPALFHTPSPANLNQQQSMTKKRQTSVATNHTLSQSTPKTQPPPNTTSPSNMHTPHGLSYAQALTAPLPRSTVTRPKKQRPGNTMWTRTPPDSPPSKSTHRT